MHFAAIVVGRAALACGPVAKLSLRYMAWRAGTGESVYEHDDRCSSVTYLFARVSKDAPTCCLATVALQEGGYTLDAHPCTHE